MDGIVLTAKSLDVELGERLIIRNITLSLSSRETLGIIGPNGVGKTTLLKALAGLLTPVRGSIWSREKVFLVPQNDLLLPWKRLRDNILLAHPNPGSEESVRALKEVSSILDMAEYLDKYPRHVSGGTRRKAAIARALVSGARILLFDEPFTGLDVATTAALTRYLTGLKERGYPMIIVSHQLAELSALADRVMILNGKPGRVASEINLTGIRDTSLRFSVVRKALEETLFSPQS